MEFYGNPPWILHGRFSMKSFPRNFMEYKSVTSILQDRQACRFSQNLQFQKNLLCSSCSSRQKVYRKFIKLKYWITVHFKHMSILLKMTHLEKAEIPV